MLRPVYVFLVFGLFFASSFGHYEPNWASIDSRPLPGWYDQAKFGIFIHWGVFSVPSFGSEWFWQMWNTGNAAVQKFIKDQYPPKWTYQDFARDFDAYMFDPDWWADLLKDSGAKYVVLTSKHHEGYTLWPSNVSFSWNSKDVGPNRDLVGDLAAAIRNRTDIRFGLYHSMFEWYNQLYLQDKANEFQTNRFVEFKTMPELHEIVNAYKPEVIWSDGDWEASHKYWNSTGFLAWLYNESPVKDTVVVNDRWGAGIPCKHGGYWTCTDHYNPGTVVPHKWENCDTLDRYSWGYRREATFSDYLSDLDVVTRLATTVSCGGNLLMNMGPRKDGKIDPLMEERLRNIGKWLRVNGEAIYGTQPWIYQNETEVPVWYTAKTASSGKVTVYAIVLKWPGDGKILLANVDPTSQTRISMLGFGGSEISTKFQALKKAFDDESPAGVIVDLSPIRFVDLPSTVAWVLKLENLAKNQQQIHPVVAKNYIFS